MSRLATTGAAATLLLMLTACATVDQAHYSVLLQSNDLDTLSDKIISAEGKVTHRLPVINGIGARLTSRGIKALEDSKDIDQMIVDRAVADQQPTSTAPEAVQQWLVRTHKMPSINAYLSELTGASALHELGFTGAGVGIALLDTGIWHSSDRLREGREPARHYNAITDDTEGNVDLDGHGTHLASLITGVDGKTAGIASGAELIDIKAFDRYGEANYLDVVRGIQWVIEHQDTLNIRVLNISISASSELPYWLDPINQAIIKAWDAGVTVVVAAGNTGPEYGSVTAPGNNPWPLTVGAIDTGTIPSKIDDRVAIFSASGPTASKHIKPDILVPGTFLAGRLAPTADRSTGSLAVDQNGLWVASGSSQASAVASGLIALLLEYDPSLSNHDIKCLLTTSADFGTLASGQPAASPFRQGHGYINLEAALNTGQRDCASSLARISADTKLVGKVTDEQISHAKEIDTTPAAAEGVGKPEIFWGTSPQEIRVLEN